MKNSFSKKSKFEFAFEFAFKIFKIRIRIRKFAEIRKFARIRILIRIRKFVFIIDRYSGQQLGEKALTYHNLSPQEQSFLCLLSATHQNGRK